MMKQKIYELEINIYESKIELEKITKKLEGELLVLLNDFYNENVPYFRDGKYSEHTYLYLKTKFNCIEVRYEYNTKEYAPTTFLIFNIWQTKGLQFEKIETLNIENLNELADKINILLDIEEQ